MYKKLGIISLVVLILCMTMGISACNKRKISVNFLVEPHQVWTIYVDEGKAPTLPPDPKREGYTFDGWYFDAGTWEQPYSEQEYMEITKNTDMILIHGHYFEEKMLIENAVNIYKQRNSMYIKFSTERAGEKEQVEWYEDHDKMILKFITEEESLIVYYNREDGKRYFVDTKREIKVDYSFTIANLLPPIEGDGTQGTVLLKGVWYDTLDFVIDESLKVRFLNNKGLSAILMESDNEIYAEYTVISFGLRIPTNSDLYGVEDYKISNYILTACQSDDMFPTLEIGKMYYFEKVGKNDLQVGDIVYVRANEDIISRITNIDYADNGDEIYTLKSDNTDMASEAQFTYSDIIGVFAMPV